MTNAMKRASPRERGVGVIFIRTSCCSDLNAQETIIEWAGASHTHIVPQCDVVPHQCNYGALATLLQWPCRINQGM